MCNLNGPFGNELWHNLEFYVASTWDRQLPASTWRNFFFFLIISSASFFGYWVLVDDLIRFLGNFIIFLNYFISTYLFVYYYWLILFFFYCILFLFWVIFGLSVDELFPLLPYLILISTVVVAVLVKVYCYFHIATVIFLSSCNAILFSQLLY